MTDLDLDRLEELMRGATGVMVRAPDGGFASIDGAIIVTLVARVRDLEARAATLNEAVEDEDWINGAEARIRYRDDGYAELPQSDMHGLLWAFRVAKAQTETFPAARARARRGHRGRRVTSRLARIEAELSGDTHPDAVAVVTENDLRLLIAVARAATCQEWDESYCWDRVGEPSSWAGDGGCIRSSNDYCPTCRTLAPLLSDEEETA